MILYLEHQQQHRLESVYQSSEDLGSDSSLRGRHVPISQKDRRSGISSIQDPGFYRILDRIFSFSHGILEILVPVTKFPWDPRDLGSRTDMILLDPEDPGSSLSSLPWDLADLGSYTIIMSLYFDHPLHQMPFCLWFSISMRFLTLSTVNNFNHTLVQPFCVGLKAARHNLITKCSELHFRCYVLFQ